MTLACGSVGNYSCVTPLNNRLMQLLLTQSSPALGMEGGGPNDPLGFSIIRVAAAGNPGGLARPMVRQARLTRISTD